ncbi:MAG: winged helix DNA-binding domain-containing protein [Acidimicrobiales bacterium]
MSVKIDRGRALAYRLGALDLAGPAAAAGRAAVGLLDLGVLDLGVQDTPPGSARLSLATRLGADLDPFAHDGIAMAWSTRGSPHVHRAPDLPAFADALWPLSDRDATARLGSGGKALASTDLAPLDGFAIAVAAMAEVITRPMTKPEASAAVTAHLPDELSGFCEPCGSVHVYEMLFRCAALPAGVGIVPGRRPLTLAPVAGWLGSAPDPAATIDLLTTYLALLGPGTAADAAAFVGTTAAEARRIWTTRSNSSTSGGLPAGLVEVVVDGRPGWFPDDLVDELTEADPARVGDAVQLIAPGDALLKGGDREVLVPDADARKQLWRVLNNPGAVLAGIDVVGLWRPKQSGRRLTITVTPFSTLASRTRAAIADQAELVAAVRGATSVDLAYVD